MENTQLLHLSAKFDLNLLIFGLTLLEHFMKKVHIERMRFFLKNCASYDPLFLLNSRIVVLQISSKTILRFLRNPPNFFVYFTLHVTCNL